MGYLDIGGDPGATRRGERRSRLGCVYPFESGNVASHRLDGSGEDCVSDAQTPEGLRVDRFCVGTTMEPVLMRKYTSISRLKSAGRYTDIRTVSMSSVW